MITVLALHSGGFTSRQWKRLAALLAPRYRVVTPDLIGYSPADRVAPGTPFHFSADVARLATMLDEPAHVVGHSYGGFLAMQLALAHPERVRSLAVYEPVTFGLLDEPADASARDAIAAIHPFVPDATGNDEAWLAGFIDWWQGPGVWAKLASGTKHAFRDVGWKVSQEVASLSSDCTSSARYATIVAPALVLAGGRTPAAELHVATKLARVLPNATLEVFADLAHMGPLTAADRVNASIAAFLDAH